MTRRRWPAAACAIAVAALLGGCGLGMGDENFSTPTGTGAGPVVPQRATGSDNGGTTGGTAGPSEPTGSLPPSPGSAGGAVTEIRDGVWDVGDAGQVEFRVSGGRLELTAAHPASGWQQEAPVKQADQIEVRFTQPAGRIWTFRVQVTGSTMQITKGQTIPKAAPGSYPVGAAGVVGLVSSGSELKLGTVTPEAGWSVAKQQSSPTSISVSLKRDGGTAQFTASRSGTDVTVTTSQQLSGPVPAT